MQSQTISSARILTRSSLNERLIAKEDFIKKLIKTFLSGLVLRSANWVRYYQMMSELSKTLSILLQFFPRSYHLLRELADILLSRFIKGGEGDVCVDQGRAGGDNVNHPHLPVNPGVLHGVPHTQHLHNTHHTRQVKKSSSNLLALWPSPDHIGIIFPEYDPSIAAIGLLLCSLFFHPRFYQLRYQVFLIKFSSDSSGGRNKIKLKMKAVKSVN